MSMHLDALPEKTAKLLNDISNRDFLNSFYLSGGTALSLQIAHRESEDLDFFSGQEFDPRNLQIKLLQFGKLEGQEVAENTLNLFLDGVKLQFLYYPYSLLEPLISWKNISMSSLLDIACTKIITISMRGSKKDFIDLFFLLKEFDLKTLFAKLPKKYVGMDYNIPHLMKSLVYFDDADAQPMPKMHVETDWGEVKKTIIHKVRELKF